MITVLKLRLVIAILIFVNKNFATDLYPYFVERINVHNYTLTLTADNPNNSLSCISSIDLFSSTLQVNLYRLQLLASRFGFSEPAS